MFPAAIFLFVILSIGIWALLVGAKAHDKMGDMAEKFVENNLKEKGENENE